MNGVININNLGSNNYKITHSLQKEDISNYFRLLKPKTIKCKKYFNSVFMKS